MAKYKAYPEYKDSGIESLDTIPKIWSIKKLKYIFEIKKRIAGKIGFDVLSVTQKGIKIKDIESGEGQLSMDYSKYQRVYPGEFAMNHMDLLTGYVDISNYDGVTSPDYRVFAVRDKRCFYSRYYLYLLQDGYKQRRFFHLGQGSAHLGRWRLPTEAFNEIVYPCPSLKEQIHIASFLDHETAKIDNLIEKQQQLIELLKEKRQAVISHAVTKGLNPDAPMKDSGVEWLGKVPEHWKICRIKQLSKQISKGTTPSTIGGDFVDEGIRFLKAENIGKSKFVNSLPEFYITNDVDKQISRSRLQERDVLVIIAGATTGMASVLQKEILPANTNQAVSFIRTKNINHADWIYYWLGTDTIQRIIGMGAVQAAQPNLSMEDLGNIPILLPEQDELASICMEIEKQFVQFESLICKAESAIDLMQERRTALISAAVTGKIDVRDWVSPDTQDIEEPQEATA
ncbi:restriction endonuclease subunit S [Raoultella terrigena]|uniref:restriction endonuclease subunit S n=1 Tax=Raoultella terrigena TaxID=577 RepID=UPI002F95D9B8